MSGCYVMSGSVTFIMLCEVMFLMSSYVRSCYVMFAQLFTGSCTI